MNYLLLTLILTVIGVSSHTLPTSEALIAFHVTISRDQIALLPRFLKNIYHPSNLYLLDFDQPLDPQTTFPDPPANVHLRSAEPYVPHGVSHVINILEGMSFFLDHEDVEKAPPFDYFIHTSPSEYPTVTATRLRKILYTAPDRPSPNYFHFAHPSQWKLFSKEIDYVHFDYSLSLTHNASLTQSLQSTKLQHPGRSRRKWTIPRTAGFFAVNHAYVRLAVDSMLSKNLLMTLAEASHVYEHFFGALALNDEEQSQLLVRNSSLRCVDMSGLDEKAKDTLPVYETRTPSVEFLKKTELPCLFTGPFVEESSDSLAVRDEIDTHILGSDSSRERLHAFYTSVYRRLGAVIRSNGLAR